MKMKIKKGKKKKLCGFSQASTNNNGKSIGKFHNVC